MTFKTQYIRVVAISSRFLLAGVFAASAIGKVRSPTRFFSFLNELSLLRFVHPPTVLYAIITIELLIIVLLLRAVTARFGGLFSFAFLLVLTFTLMIASKDGVAIECGCFGDLVGEESVGGSILRNLFLLLLSAGVVFVNDDRVKGV